MRSRMAAKPARASAGRVVRRSVLSLGVAVGMMAALVSPSQAAPARPEPSKTVTVPMTLQKEVSAVTHGDTVTVTLASGNRFDLPATTYRHSKAALAKSTGVHPNNTVFGNCGYSYTYLYDWYGARHYRLAVGFHVDAAAVAYSWGAYVNGAGRTYYEYHYRASGGLAFRHDWAGGHTGTVPRSDYYDADTYYGAAELYYGSWCFAGYSSDAQYVS